jgi:hypothetical protein
MEFDKFTTKTKERRQRTKISDKDGEERRREREETNPLAGDLDDGRVLSGLVDGHDVLQRNEGAEVLRVLVLGKGRVRGGIHTSGERR